ncbi:MAG: alkaline phosphatase family protein [Candidatus Omnitrophota bacterium]
MENKTETTKSRVIVIGLDGATWTNLRPWMEQGLLPNLKFLVDNGASGELKSTIPYRSSTSWTSFMTGVNPGKHGVFDFIKPFRNKTYNKEFTTSRDIKTKTIFEILTDFKRTSGVINLPMTYPPFEIRGGMISCGLTTPDNNCNFTFPNNLFEKSGIKKEEYILNINWMNYSKDEKESFFADIIKCSEQRKEISFKLMDALDWDLFVLVFGETDWLQHFCWHYIDPTHSKHDPIEAEKFLPLIIKYYQKLDSIIGEFIIRTDENTSLFIISDHGFGPREKIISLHRILEENGFLYYKNNSLLKKIEIITDKIRKKMHEKCYLYRVLKLIVRNIFYKNIKVIQKNDVCLKKPRKITFGSDVGSMYWQSINWKKTFCYSGYADNTIFFNLKNREPDGIISSKGDYNDIRGRVIGLISNLFDPELGRNLRVKIDKKEEIYSGPFTQDGFDLCLEIEDGRYLLRSGANTREIFRLSEDWTGTHKKNGVIICYGNSFKKALHLENAQIIDLTPSILYLLGIPILYDFDGKVLKDAIKNDYLIQKPIEYKVVSEKNSEIKRVKNSNDKEDISKVEKRLADLGYI